MTTAIRRRENEPETRPTFDVRLSNAPDLRLHPLAPFIAKRSVQRRALSTRPVTHAAKSALEAAVGPAHLVRWLEGFASRRAVAALMFHNSKLRLTAPEAYAVHRDVSPGTAATVKARFPMPRSGSTP